MKLIPLIQAKQTISIVDYNDSTPSLLKLCVWAIWQPKIKGLNSKSYYVLYFIASQPMGMYSIYSRLKSRSKKCIFYKCGSVDANWFYLTWGCGEGDQGTLSVKGQMISNLGSVSPRVSVIVQERSQTL